MVRVSLFAEPGIYNMHFINTWVDWFRNGCVAGIAYKYWQFFCSFTNTGGCLGWLFYYSCRLSCDWTGDILSVCDALTLQEVNVLLKDFSSANDFCVSVRMESQEILQQVVPCILSCSSYAFRRSSKNWLFSGKADCWFSTNRVTFHRIRETHSLFCHFLMWIYL